MRTIERRRLPGTDLVISLFCYGAGGFGSDLRGEEVADRISRFRDAGGNFLDTAHCYAFWVPAGAGCSERALADYMSRNGKGDLVIGTKGGHPGAPGYRRVEHWLSPARIEADIDDSLARLGVDTIDLFWLHRDETRFPAGEIIETLNREIRRGRIRHVGASNWRPARIAEANAYAAAHGLRGFAASQPEWNLARKIASNPDPATDTSHGDVMLFLEGPDQESHRRTQLPVIPYSANACGYFATGGQKAAGAYDSSESRRRLVKTQALARDLDVTPGQIALAWLLHQPFPVFPIIGPRDPEHLREDLDAAHIRLSDEQVRWLVE